MAVIHQSFSSSTPSQPSPKFQLIIPCGLSAGMARNGHLAEACAGWVLQLLTFWPEGGFGVAINGELFDNWIRHQPGFLAELGRLAAQNKIEILSQLFYGGDYQAWSEQELFAQLQMAQECWSSYLSEPPVGLYVPSSSWSPQVIAVAQQVGLAYAVVGSEQLEQDRWQPHRPYVQLEALGHRLGCFVAHVLHASDPSRFSEQWQAVLTNHPHAREGRGAKTLYSYRHPKPLPQPVVLGHHWRQGMMQLPWLLSCLQETKTASLIDLSLPRSCFAEHIPGIPARLLPAPPAALQSLDVSLAWETDLLRRMTLALGQKLQEAWLGLQEQAQMTPRETEQRYGSDLATVQRYLASAQPLLEGLGDWSDGQQRAAWKQSMWQKLFMARQMLDSLEQNNQMPWLALDEICLDGDGLPEYVLSGSSQMVGVAVHAGLRLLCWQEGRYGDSLLHPSWPGHALPPDSATAWGPGAWFGAVAESLDGSAFFAGRMANHWHAYPLQGWQTVEQSFTESPQVSATLFGQYEPPADLGQHLESLPSDIQGPAQVGLSWQWTVESERCAWRWQVESSGGISPSQGQAAAQQRWLVCMPCMLPDGKERVEGELIEGYRQWPDCRSLTITNETRASLHFTSNVPMQVWLQPAPAGFAGGVWLALSVPTGTGPWELSCHYAVDGQPTL